jgi:hypothetical protein
VGVADEGPQDPAHLRADDDIDQQPHAEDAARAPRVAAAGRRHRLALGPVGGEDRAHRAVEEGQAHRARQREEQHVEEDHEGVAVGADGEEGRHRREAGEHAEVHGDGRDEQPQRVAQAQPRVGQRREDVERGEGHDEREQEEQRHLERRGEQVLPAVVAAAGGREQAHAQAVDRAEQQAGRDEAARGQPDLAAAELVGTRELAAQQAVELRQPLAHGAAA